MFDAIIFHNRFGHGDVYVSRSFVRWVVENVLANKYIYYHNSYPNSLDDIFKLHYGGPTWALDKTLHNSGAQIDNNHLIINTWYGADYGKYFVGPNLRTIHNIFKTTIKQTINKTIPPIGIQWLPEVDFKAIRHSLRDTRTFLESVEKQHKVLICNNDTLSGQSENFDMNIHIELLARSFPNSIFIISNRIGKTINLNNVIYSDDISKKYPNLFDISLISLASNIIIGRDSGSHTYCYTRSGLLTPGKIFISLSKCNFLGDIKDQIKAQWISSHNYDMGSVQQLLEQTIRKQYEN